MASTSPDSSDGVETEGRTASLLEVLPAQSAVLVESRSSIGVISFGTTTVTGQFRGVVVGTEIDVSQRPQASLILPVASLVSGNSLHDAEMRRRLSAQRYPSIAAELISAEALGAGRYAVTGNLTIRGISHHQSATIQIGIAEPPPPGADDAVGSHAVLLASGNLTIDMRDFGVALPHVLRMQVYPEVNVSFRLAVGPATRGGGALG